VINKKFALQWLPGGETIMPARRQQVLFEERPRIFKPIRVGTVFSCVVGIAALSRRELQEIAIAAWTTVVPKRLAQAYLTGKYAEPPQPLAAATAADSCKTRNPRRGAPNRLGWRDARFRHRRHDQRGRNRRRHSEAEPVLCVSRHREKNGAGIRYNLKQ
jgi:hypothetical protein